MRYMSHRQGTISFTSTLDTFFLAFTSPYQFKAYASCSLVDDCGPKHKEPSMAIKTKTEKYHCKKRPA